jgi:hypothetical protein
MRSWVGDSYLGKYQNPGQIHSQLMLVLLILQKWVVGFAGDYVAHIKFTILLMPNGSDRVTSHPLQELLPTKTIDHPEIKAWFM